MTRAPRLVLASASPRRSELLDQMGLAHEVWPASVDEAYEDGETCARYVERLARAKAGAVARTRTDTLVVGGDTVVVRDGLLLGKPERPRDAVAMLLSLAGRSHTVLSGVALAGAHGMLSAVGEAEVRFRSFGAETAERYVATGEPMDKAGAYGIQGFGAALVDSIAGDYYAVVGLPLARLLGLLEQAGWRYAFGRLEPL